MSRATPREIDLRGVEAGWAARFRAMGSPCEVLLESGITRGDAERAVRLVADEAWRIEDKFSRYIAGNVIDRVNKAGGLPVELDDETARLIDFSRTLHELSDGRFDITSGVLRAVWTFDGGEKVPDEGAVAAVLERVGWQRANWEPPVLVLPEGMEIDLGGVGKEYAVDRCVELIRVAGVGQGLVNFGGDLGVTGPPERRNAWKIAVEGRTESQADHQIELRQGAIATSGDARRFLLRNGIRYGHILDPRSGWPVRDAPSSVTVAADTCTQAGMLSTLAMLEGSAAEAFLRRQDVLFWCRR